MVSHAGIASLCNFSSNVSHCSIFLLFLVWNLFRSNILFFSKIMFHSSDSHFLNYSLVGLFFIYLIFLDFSDGHLECRNDIFSSYFCSFFFFFKAWEAFFHKVSNKILESDYVFKTRPSILPHFPWTESQIATLYR